MNVKLKVNSVFGDPPAIAQVALDVPIAPWFDYRIGRDLQGCLAPGVWVRVPWASGQRVGIVVGLSSQTDIEPDRLREVTGVLEQAPIAPENWLALLRFGAGYYHRGVGELGLLAVPRTLRSPPAPKARQNAFARARSAWGRPSARRALAAAGGGLEGPSGAYEPPAAAAASTVPTAPTSPTVPIAPAAPIVPIAPTPQVSSRQDGLPLGADQQWVLDALVGGDGFAVWLLHGVTGSGKTEVYLRWFEAILARRAGAQVLLMVPEIALTPQLAGLVARRFPPEAVAVLHSNLTEAERARAWLAAAEGRVRVVIGTRLAVLTPLPGLAAIVVDEEHDASYRQQDGLHYSARDLAVAAASLAKVPVLLGSATPSLESWHAARRGKYRLLRMPKRIGGGALPTLSLIDMRAFRTRAALAPAAIEAIGATLARGEQALVFINRRGYAPVLTCEACGWLSDCPNCSAWRVLHQRAQAPAAARNAGPPARYQLVCHHCGVDAPVPPACPSCGNIGLSGLGRGTQRLEEELAERFPDSRIARLDRDVARRRGAAQAVITAVHEGEVDLLVGTQMLAKGHDFRRLSLVVVVDGDAGLYSADFRASERLFATLMQVAGRAGRDALASRVLVQTRFPDHPLFACLLRHDYDGFADTLLAERREAGMPPFGHQALLRAEAATIGEALEFLRLARDIGEQCLAETPSDEIVLFDAVPLSMARLKGREREQLLVESRDRRALHGFVEAWGAAQRGQRTRAPWQQGNDPPEN